MTKDAIGNLGELQQMAPPIKRAAYSDRTAWLMAVLSELAYMRFDEDDDNVVLTLAGELAKITDRKKIADRLRWLESVLGARAQGGASANEVLRRALDAGGFSLKGVFFDASTDTQGYVAVRRTDDGLGMAVVVFRGTQQIRDWLTNLDATKTPVVSDRGERKDVLGNVHKGFKRAFLSVRDQINEHLDDERELPLFVTGHSLGGALATLATWYERGDRLAACYTFGAPRVGDGGLTDRFRTPVYRLVNGADPVPFVPPSGLVVEGLKVVLRVVGTVVGPVDKLADRLVRLQGYRHYGYQRYLSICQQGAAGNYPRLRNEFGVSSLERLWRLVLRMLRGQFTRGWRIDKYHDIGLYRAKLRAYAIRRQQQL